MGGQVFKVFLSSVRRGLEEERDALSGLLKALGHIPIRFEDFTAQLVPSREACLRGVEGADVYVLLLGAAYGDPLPDTGTAPTEEELIVARRRGIPILAFKKSGVTLEPHQAEFIRRIEDYRAGYFRQSFKNTAELQTAVASAIRALELAPARLEWQPLDLPPPVRWVVAQPANNRVGTDTILEVHAIAIGARALLASELEGLPPPLLARRGREMGLFREEEGVESTGDQASASASVSGRVRTCGIRVERTGATAVWEDLGRDNMGAILDPADLASRIARMIRVATQGMPPDGPVTFAVGLGGTSMAVLGSLGELGHRQRVTIGFAAQDHVQVEPQDSVSMSALPAAAVEVAGELTARLVQKYRASRR